MFSTIGPEMARKFLNRSVKAHAEVGEANKQFTKLNFYSCLKVQIRIL
jgi:hypothetical protein